MINLYLDDEKITLEQLKETLDNLQAFDSCYDVIELDNIRGNSIYLEKHTYSAFSY